MNIRHHTRLGDARRGSAALLVVLAALVTAAFVALPPPAAVADGRTPALADDVVVYRILVHGEIEHGLAPFIERSLREAAQAGAQAAILDIETPGGRVDAAQRIANALSDAEIPVYAFVNRRAYSAGALIALATRGIYMRQGAVIGAATPVTGEGETAPEKIVSAMRSEMRALAEARGLDPRVAESMVDADVEIEGVVERGKLLTLTVDEAVAIGYAHSVADWDDLLEQLGLAGARAETPVLNWAERVVRVLTSGLVTPLLLSIGFLGLLFELKTPGFGVGGTIGAIALALFFGSHYLLGLAGWEHVILMGIGLVLLGIEIFLVPGFGIFGVAGIVGVLASIYLSLIGRMPMGVDYTHAAAVLSTSIVITLVGAWVLARILPRSGRFVRSGILLAEATTRDSGYLSAAVRTDLLGQKGITITDLRPAGAARFGDERVDVVAEEGWVPAGTTVQVVRTEGYRHVVRSVG